MSKSDSPFCPKCGMLKSRCKCKKGISKKSKKKNSREGRQQKFSQLILGKFILNKFCIESIKRDIYSLISKIKNKTYECKELRQTIRQNKAHKDIKIPINISSKRYASLDELIRVYINTFKIFIDSEITQLNKRFKECISMNIAMEYEHLNGRYPLNVSKVRKDVWKIPLNIPQKIDIDFDIISASSYPTPLNLRDIKDFRLIEVKCREKGSKIQFEDSQVISMEMLQDKYWIYVIMINSSLYNGDWDNSLALYIMKGDDCFKLVKVGSFNKHELSFEDVMRLAIETYKIKITGDLLELCKKYVDLLRLWSKAQSELLLDYIFL